MTGHLQALSLRVQMASQLRKKEIALQIIAIATLIDRHSTRPVTAQCCWVTLGITASFLLTVLTFRKCALPKADIARSVFGMFSLIRMFVHSSNTDCMNKIFTCWFSRIVTVEFQSRLVFFVCVVERKTLFCFSSKWRV